MEHIRYKTEHRQESLFKSLHRKQKENTSDLNPDTLS